MRLAWMTRTYRWSGWERVRCGAPWLIAGFALGVAIDIIVRLCT